jgi:methylase of polypeptide subunit release factors
MRDKSDKLPDQWLTFYQTIKDESWPELSSRSDVLSLSQEILTEILLDHTTTVPSIDADVSKIRRLSDIRKDWVITDNASYFLDDRQLAHRNTFMANDIEIWYHSCLDGGGTGFGQDYKKAISDLYPGRTFESCFEWCSGPGFIGFDLLSRNFCKKLFLSDIYLPAIESIKTTVKKNSSRCQDRVFYHHCSSVADLPDDWKFDLVVANPPHWNSDVQHLISQINFNDRICADHGWKIHNDFFSSIKKYLLPDAVILLQEQSYASGPDMFKFMIEQNGMYINDCYWYPSKDSYYYLEVKQKNV